MTAAGSALVLPACLHARLRDHLFPGDGLEAAAILFCRDAGLSRRKLLAVDVLPVPYGDCSVREPDRLTWPGSSLSEAIDRAEDEGLTIILAHSHPGGFFGFSSVDDESDAATISAIFNGWSGAAAPAGHGSAIMTPDGRMLARLYDAHEGSQEVGLVAVIGENLHFWTPDDAHSSPPMAFGSGMTQTLGRLHACIVGVSGTGSVVAEQTARMGFGEITLIDFDLVEHKNLNRILNSTLQDADASIAKVDMFASAIRQIRPEVTIHVVKASVATREAVLAAATSDIVFSCVDTAEGRQISDMLAQAFLVPLIDMGVTIPTRRTPDGHAAVAEVMGRIDYVFPGGSTLADRGVYSSTSLRAEYLARAAPGTFAAEVDAGYIRGAPEEAPSVIALNMRAASDAVLEFIARAFPFRHTPNGYRARTVFALADGETEIFAEDDFSLARAYPVATGAAEPLLGLPALGI